MNTETYTSTMSGPIEGRALPLVAIAGRPNVGKSTLFNRLLGTRRAITDPTAGLTRDPVTEEAVILGRPLLLTDTGGFRLEGPSDGDEGLLEQAVVDRALGVIEQADLVILLFEAGAISGEDEEFIETLRPVREKLLVAVNKTEGGRKSAEAWNLLQYGFDDILMISAEHGDNIEALKAAIIGRLPDTAGAGGEGVEAAEGAAVPDKANRYEEGVTVSPEGGGMEAAGSGHDAQRRDDIFDEGKNVKLKNPQGCGGRDAAESGRDAQRRDDEERGYSAALRQAQKPAGRRGMDAAESGHDAQRRDDEERRYSAALRQAQKPAGGRFLSRARDRSGNPAAPEGRGVGADSPVPAEGGNAPLINTERECIRITLIGKPNSGKSTLTNRLTASTLSIVSPIPGTTRDVLRGGFAWKGRQFVVCDTAGIRRRSKVTENIEYYSVNRAIKTMDAVDIVILLVDAQEGFSEQDKKIAALACERGRGVIFALNKWDAMGEVKNTFTAVCDKIRFFFGQMSWAPIHAMSALTGSGVDGLLDTCITMYGQLTRHTSTGALNAALESWQIEHPPPLSTAGRFHIKYAVQTSANPVVFRLFVSRPAACKDAYLAYLQRKIRTALGYSMIPVKLELKKSAGPGIGREKHEGRRSGHGTQGGSRGGGHGGKHGGKHGGSRGGKGRPPARSR